MSLNLQRQTSQTENPAQVDMMPMLQVRDLVRNYAPSFQLCVSSLELRKGQTLCLLGPTGSGKSTLLKLIAGLDGADSGEILIQEQPLVTPRSSLAVRRKVAMVFQRPQLLTGTVLKNVTYGLRVRGLAKHHQSEVSRILNDLRLLELSERRADRLSGGQQQLVAIARALVLKPELLILDEPTANLDPAHVALVEMVIKQVQQEQGTTILWATHNLFQTRRISDRTAFLLNGKQIEEGETDVVLTRPEDSRTADFVEGRMIF